MSSTKLWIKSFRKIAVILLIIGWVFSGWLPIWQNGRIVMETQVAFAGTAGPTNCGTAADDNTVGTVTWSNVTNACTSGQNTTAAGLKTTVLSHYIKATNFGFTIPTGSTIQGITVTVSKSGTQGSGNRVVVDNSVDIVKGGVIQTTQDKADTSTAWPTTKTAVSYGGTADLWLLSWTAADINSSGFGVAISAKGKSTTAETATVYAFVTITVTYNAPPNVPSQDSPANSATGVSVTPTFLTTATDPDSDNLGYKVTIYSNSACTTIVGSAHDQAVDSTGWSGQNATCTNNPTSCYTSGTQGSFTLQSADTLSNSTQYWWKASAKDPDGSGTFTDSSTCNTFTTVAAAVVSVSVSDGAITYGTIPANSTKSTCSSELNDAQTVTNDGNVTENFNIRGQNSANWTLAATAGSDQYIQNFLNGSCSTFSGGTVLTTSDQAFATGIAPSGTATLNLQINTPNPSSVYTQQSVDVIITAVQG